MAILCSGGTAIAGDVSEMIIGPHFSRARRFVAVNDGRTVADGVAFVSGPSA
jgi:hypothetical protein